MSGGCFKKPPELLNLRDLKILTSEYDTHRSMYGLDILCEISKGKMSCPYIERYDFYIQCSNLESSEI